MWKFSILLFLISCAPTYIKGPIVPIEVIKTCDSECVNNYVSYRDSKTFFCQCVKKDKILVIGRMGTVYQ